MRLTRPSKRPTEVECPRAQLVAAQPLQLHPRPSHARFCRLIFALHLHCELSEAAPFPDFEATRPRHCYRCVGSRVVALGLRLNGDLVSDWWVLTSETPQVVRACPCCRMSPRTGGPEGRVEAACRCIELSSNAGICCRLHSPRQCMLSATIQVTDSEKACSSPGSGAHISHPIPSLVPFVIRRRRGLDLLIDDLL